MLNSLQKIIIVSFLFFGCGLATATDYVIDGDTVFINDNNVYLSAYPHTLNESGYVYFNFTSYHYDKPIDFYFGFNSLHCKPVSAEFLKNGGWIDISDKFGSKNFNYDGMNKWYYLNDININSNTNYTLRAYLEINQISTGGKYGVAVKPSSETISQSINNGHFYYLDPWYEGDYLYRKNITIKGEIGAGTDYQVKLEIGDSVGGDFHLEGHCTNFPQDIIITDDDGITPLDFWIENITADPIIVWSKVDDDLGTDQNIMIYYGKSGATTCSDGVATFLLFDDFADGDYTADPVWTVVSGTWDASSNYLKKTATAGGWEQIKTPSLVAENAVWEFNFTLDGLAESNKFLVDIIWTDANNYVTVLINPNTPNQQFRLIVTTGGVETAYIYPWAKDTDPHRVKITRDVTNEWKCYIDDVLYGTESNSDQTSSVSLSHRSYGINNQIDDIRVRKHNSPEPAFASADAEEVHEITPPDPTNLQNTTGNFWINHTWQPGAGNITDSYNVSVNDVWHNETINTYWNVIYEYGNDSWQNITIWAYNNSGIGFLSTNSISQNTQLYFTNLPTNLQYTHNDFWVNWTWSESFIGTHIIDTYNVSINNTWYNSTTNEYYNHTDLDYELTSSIIVYGYNDTNGLSIYYISGSYTFPIKSKMVNAIQQLSEPLILAKDKLFKIIPFVIAIILFAGFGLAIMVMTSKLKKW